MTCNTCVRVPAILMVTHCRRVDIGVGLEPGANLLSGCKKSNRVTGAHTIVQPDSLVPCEGGRAVGVVNPSRGRHRRWHTHVFVLT